MSRALRPLALLALAAVATASAAADDWPLPTAEPADLGFHAGRLDRIGSAMQRYIDADLVSGTVTLIARRGQIVHLEARGQRDAERGTPMTADTIFRIASMTKPITSIALMMLWEEGHFQLDDPVARYLPEFEGVQQSSTGDVSGNTGSLLPPRNPPTIRQLLTHTAGLANGYIGNPSAYRELIRGPADQDLDDLIKRMAALPLTYEPGSEWQYSAATDVVGRLVEVFSGQTLDDFMRTRIFEPLQMPDTHFFLKAREANRLGVQYTPGDDQRIVPADPAGQSSRWVTSPGTLYRGAGGLVSTIGDYVRIQQLMLNGGELDGVRLLGPHTVTLMFENHIGDLPVWLRGPGYGFGLGYSVLVDRGAAGSPAAEGTAGWGGAFCTMFWVDPTNEVIGILMTQVRPYTHLNIRQEFQVLTYQALLD